MHWYHVLPSVHFEAETPKRVAVRGAQALPSMASPSCPQWCRLAAAVTALAAGPLSGGSTTAGRSCWLDSTLCPLPTHSCDVPACSYALEWPDPPTGLPVGTTCYTCHAELCGQRAAPAGSCQTAGDDLECDATQDPSICAATPHAALHPGIWQNECIAYCHCQGYHGCEGDVGFELAAPPPPPLVSTHAIPSTDWFSGMLLRDACDHSTPSRTATFTKARFRTGRWKGGACIGTREDLDAIAAALGPPPCADSPAVCRYASGNVYTGFFRKGKPHGPGAVFVCKYSKQSPPQLDERDVSEACLCLQTRMAINTRVHSWRV